MIYAFDGRPEEASVATTTNMLVDILDLERIEENIFRGRSPDEDLQRVFGGQVAGQALVAAGRTVPPDRPVHSLHAYFIRPLSRRTDRLHRRSDPRRPLLHHPPGGRGPAWAGDLRAVGVVPGGRAGSGVTGGAHARSA
jgi:hypothetical protein